MGSLAGPRRVAVVSTAMIVLAGACGAEPTDEVATGVVLGATEDLSTSQSFTWRTSEESATAPEVVVVGPEGPGSTTRRVVGARKTPTTVGQTGSDAPAYAATVTGLEPGTTYEYRVEVAGKSTPTRTFTTADDEIGSWSFLAFGDTQRDIDGVGADVVAEAVRAHPEAELVLHAGDLVEVPHRQDEWLAAMAALEPVRATRPVVVARGNHERCVLVRDCRDPDGRAFAAWFTSPGTEQQEQARPWYRFDRQGVRFVVLDSFGDDLEAQAAFLEESLASNDERWSVVLLHAVPFASRDKRTNTAVFTQWLPILERHDGRPRPQRPRPRLQPRLRAPPGRTGLRHQQLRAQGVRARRRRLAAARRHTCHRSRASEHLPGRRCRRGAPSIPSGGRPPGTGSDAGPAGRSRPRRGHDHVLGSLRPRRGRTRATRRPPVSRNRGTGGRQDRGSGQAQRSAAGTKSSPRPPV